MYLQLILVVIFFKPARLMFVYMLYGRSYMLIVSKLKLYNLFIYLNDVDALYG